MAILAGGCDSCPEPIDEVALPRHPDHDFTAAELAVFAAGDARYLFTPAQHEFIAAAKDLLDPPVIRAARPRRTRRTTMNGARS